jgi:hypothetical protein
MPSAAMLESPVEALAPLPKIDPMVHAIATNLGDERVRLTGRE